jgi:multisubunit Na+/H+ antiporter MnhB subunit
MLKQSLTIIALIVLSCLLLYALVDLPAAVGHLPVMVSGELPGSGVSHPVTAVLLNFRGYDTFLEVAVLCLALVGMLAVGPPIDRPLLSRNAMLPTLARHALPFMILAAVYLLWAGAHQPGGAFQAAAVLAAAAVLLNLSQVQTHWLSTRRWCRLAVGAGFLFFFVVAAALLPHGGLLRYPPEHAGLLIVLIESGLTVSLAVNLAAFYLLRSPVGKSENAAATTSADPTKHGIKS